MMRNTRPATGPEKIKRAETSIRRLVWSIRSNENNRTAIKNLGRSKKRIDSTHASEGRRRVTLNGRYVCEKNKIHKNLHGDVAQ